MSGAIHGRPEAVHAKAATAKRYHQSGAAFQAGVLFPASLIEVNHPPQAVRKCGCPSLITPESAGAVVGVAKPPDGVIGIAALVSPLGCKLLPAGGVIG